MAKFLSSPKLEIILSVPSGDTETKKTIESASKDGVSVEEHKEDSSLPDPNSDSVLPSNNSDTKLDEKIGDSVLPDRLLQEDSTLFGLLRRAGFEDGLLAAIQGLS